jgi:hypothetical protein
MRTDESLIELGFEHLSCDACDGSLVRFAQHVSINRNDADSINSQVLKMVFKEVEHQSSRC